MKNIFVFPIAFVTAAIGFAQSPASSVVEPHEKLPHQKLDAVRESLKRQLPSRNHPQLPQLSVANRLAPLTAKELAPKPGKLAASAGTHRKIEKDAVTRYGRWDAIAGTSQWVWRMRIESPGAAGLRVHLRYAASSGLPDGQAFVHDGAGQVFGPYPISNSTSDLWTDIVLSDAIVLEFETGVAPATILDAPPFEVLEIGHLLPGILTASAPQAAANCHLDVTCYSDWTETAKSVGHIVYEDGGNTYVCSGTLMATRNRSGIPYFLTADHCIDNEAAAQSMQVFWFYQTSACNGTPADRRNVPRSLGAKYLVSGGLSRGDFSLVQLNSVPDTVTFSGWDSAEIAAGTAVTGIHHPTGDYKRISFGQRVSQLTVGLPGANLAYFYNIEFSRGATEGGSSGSGIFSRPGVLVGTLSWGPKVEGPNAICRFQPLPTGYGRFATHFASIRDFLEDRTAGAPPPQTTTPTGPQQGTELLTGVARTVALESISSPTLFTGPRGYFVRAPQGAQRIEISLRVNGEVGLIVRADQLPTVTDGRAVGDYTSSGSTGQENVIITATSNPPLRAGAVYYVALADFAINRAVSGTLTATVSTSGTTAPPPANSRILTSGVPATFHFAAVTGSTLINGNAGYQVVVPAGATRLEIRLRTNTANADLDLFARFGQDVEIQSQRAVSDFQSDGPTGDELITITPQSSPALRPGTYYIAFGIFTSNVATTGTVTATVTGGATTTPPPNNPGGTAGTPLVSGTARSFSLAAVLAPTLINGDRGYTIQVPQGATRLDIRLSTATAGADVDLLARYGADPAVTSGKLDADFNSSGPDGNELISITPQSNPPLRAGTYFIALAVFTKNTAINGTLTANVTTASATPPPQQGGNTITPGSAVNISIPSVNAATLLTGAQGYRVVIPAGTTRMEVQLNINQADADVDLYVRKDVEPVVQNGKIVTDFSSTGPRGSETIVIDATTQPRLFAGTYFIALAVFTPGQNLTGTIRVTTTGTGGGGNNPPAGNALRSGTAAPFRFAAVDSASLMRGPSGFTIDVPAGSQRLDVRLNTTTAGADLDLYVRYDADVAIENRRPVADFVSDGDTGNESVRIEGAALKAGRYYVALGIFTTGVATSGTVTATVTGGSTATPPPAAGSRDLQPGVPSKVSLPANARPTLYAGNYGYKLTVPQGVTRVRLDLRTETPAADVDLYVRKDVDVDLIPGEGPAADYISESDTGKEAITIDASSNPPLRPGVYFIAFGNFALNVDVTSTITATFERESLTPPLSSARPLASGQSLRFNLPSVENATLFQGDFAYRIVVPEGTARLAVNIRADDPASDVDLLVRRGQETEVSQGRLVSDYSSTGDTGEEQVTVDHPPAGVYFVNLALFTTGRAVSGTIGATLAARQSAGEPAQFEKLAPVMEPIHAKATVGRLRELNRDSKGDGGGSLPLDIFHAPAAQKSGLKANAKLTLP
jgi:hypothetical protein